MVALLAIIALELGAWRTAVEAWREITYFVSHIGIEEEGPAPPEPGRHVGGLDAAHQETTDAVLRWMSAQPFPASSPRPPTVIEVRKP